MELGKIKGRIESVRTRVNVEAQTLWDSFFFERFLNRFSKSKWKNYFVFKGGFLLQNIVGVNLRSTMDIDLKIMINDLDDKKLIEILDEICNIKIDEINYKVLSISDIMANKEKKGKTAKIEAKFYNVRKVFNVDFGVGDVVTPYPIDYLFKPLIDSEQFEIYAYPIETILSEKFEALVSKGVSNSRSKDLLDIYLLSKRDYDMELLNAAIINTFNKRGVSYNYNYLYESINKVMQYDNVREQYNAYCNKHIFARDVSFDMCKDAIYEIASKLVFNDKICLEDYGIELHLVRHGDYVPTKVGGWTDDHLSEKGKSEIEVLLDIIDNHYDAFISSDLPRARETSKILNTKLKMDVNYNGGLREFDSGLLNKMTIQEFLKKYPNLYFQTIKMDERFPEGESPNLFYERVKGTFIKLLEENKNKKILLVTHGGVITIILCLIHGYPYNNNLQISPKTGSIIKLK